MVNLFTTNLNLKSNYNALFKSISFISFFLIIGLVSNTYAQTAYRFNGTSAHVVIPRNGNGILNNFSSRHDFTIEIRFRLHTMPTSGNPPIVSMHSSPADGFFIEFPSGTTNLKAGMGYGGNYLTQTSSSLSVGTWYTAALVYNNTANSFDYYIDGTSVGPTMTLPILFRPEDTYAMAIAKSLAWGDAAPIDVDFFRVWSNRQTATELNNNKLVEVSCNLAGLLLQYKFDYPQGTSQTTDCTPNLNHGTTISGVVLPVELRSFKGENTEGGNILLWETASETANKGFQVERLSGSDWESIGFVAANGKASNYQFWDKEPQPISYYRLRQIDNSGKETFSQRIVIQSKGIKKGLKVYPNPVNNLLTLSVETESYQIINFLGQVVLQNQNTLVNSIDVSALPQGSYILKTGSEQLKFIKQ